MEFQELKNNSYLKWEANRGYKEWDTFGKITNLTKDSFTILTYDDFKETTLPKDSGCLVNELELISKDDFLFYLQKEFFKTQSESLDVRRAYKNKIKHLDERLEVIQLELNKNK